MTKTKMVSMPDAMHRQLRQYEDSHKDFNFSKFVREKISELLSPQLPLKVEPHANPV